MASNINPYNINGAFPIAGQDNSSQGFRTNFTNIQNNFSFAQDEITELQSKVLLTSALTGQTVNNDMAGTKITRPQLASWTQNFADLGEVSTTAVLDFDLSSVQKIHTADSFNIQFLNWPATIGNSGKGYGILRLWIYVSDKAHVMTLPERVSIGEDTIAGYDSSNHTVTFDAVGDYIFDFSSIDGGDSYLITDVTRNRSTFRDPSFYFNNTASPSLYVGFNANSYQLVQTIKSPENSINAYGGMNVISAGELSSATVNDPSMTYGEVPGYSIIAGQGNIFQGNIQPVSNNDYLGYLNAIANVTVTGNTSSKQVGSINFFAKGTDVATGLGGNVAIFTAADGATTVSQVAGFENDQSVKFYGNVETSWRFKTDATIIEGGTHFESIPTTGGSYTFNANVSSLIVDSTSSATISAATIILPSQPVDGQRVRISSIPVITTANVWAPNSALVKFVASNKFNGNTAIQLTYIGSSSTWYLS